MQRGRRWCCSSFWHCCGLPETPSSFLVGAFSSNPGGCTHSVSSAHTNPQVLRYRGYDRFRLLTQTHRYSVSYGSYKCFRLFTQTYRYSALGVTIASVFSHKHTGILLPTGVTNASVYSHKPTGTQLRELRLLPSSHTNTQVLIWEL